MYSFSPRHKNRLAPSLCAALMALFVFSLFFFDGEYGILFVTAGSLSLVFAVTFSFRYLFCSYLYELEPDTEYRGGLLLTITETRIKKRRVVCRIGTSDAESLKKYGGRKELRGMKVYDYTVDISPDAWVITVKEDPDADEKSAVIFMPDEKMTALLKANIRGGN